jgi:hypothetical protein
VIGAQRRASCAKAVLHYSFVRNGRARAAKVKIDCESDAATVCNTHPARWVHTAGSPKRRCRFESIAVGRGSGALVGVARRHRSRFKISGPIGRRDEVAVVPRRTRRKQEGDRCRKFLERREDEHPSGIRRLLAGRPGNSKPQASQRLDFRVGLFLSISHRTQTNDFKFILP